MTEPYDPTDGPSAPEERPAAPSPFDRPGTEQGQFAGPGSGPGPAQRPGPGVGKPLLIGCGVLLLLVLVAGGLFVAYQNEIAAWLFEAMRSQLAPVVPDDLPADVRQRYDAAFDGAIQAMHEGSYDPFAMQEAQRAFTEAARDLSGDNAKMSVEDVERLTAALEKIPAAGSGEATAPGDGGTPPAAGTPPPSTEGDGGSSGSSDGAQGGEAVPGTQV